MKYTRTGTRVPVLLRKMYRTVHYGTGYPVPGTVLLLVRPTPPLGIIIISKNSPSPPEGICFSY